MGRKMMTISVMLGMTEMGAYRRTYRQAAVFCGSPEWRIWESSYSSHDGCVSGLTDFRTTWMPSEWLE